MSLISIQNLTFCHEGSWQPVFENLSLQLDSSWRLGLVGRNGRGKSTLLGLLCGRWPYRGSITAGVQFEYFPFSVPDPEQMALYAVQDCRPGLEQWQLERELNRMGADPDMLWQPFATLSQGQRTKLLLAALFCTDNAFLLIDEPTNHLDVQGRRQLAGYLAGKQGFILVSHDRDFLDSCTDHTLAINRGSVELVAGSYSVWRQQRQLRDESELAQNARLKKDIARLEQSARQAAGFAQKAERAKKGQGKNNPSGLRADRGFIGAQAARLMKRAKSIEARRNDAVEQKQQLLRDIEQNDRLILRPLDFHSPVLAEAKGLSVAYSSQKPVFSGLDFELRGGERLAVEGANGCGKSSLLRLVLGQPVPYTGWLRVAPGLVISWLPQSAEGLAGSLEDFARQKQIPYTMLLTLLRKLGFARHQLEGDMADFSDGQKKKAMLAASLCTSAHLYIWDEPLNFIDLDSRLQIEQLLLEYQPTLLFVEHDAAFVRAIATRRLKL